jgi:hypothetical protein
MAQLQNQHPSLARCCSRNISLTGEPECALSEIGHMMVG